MKDFIGTSVEALIDKETRGERQAKSDRWPATRRARYANGGKRALDVFIVVFTLWLTLPVIVVCAAIAMLDGNPPFFGHRRIGRGGVEFRCWKVRSMVADAEARLAAHLEADHEARAEWQRDRKLKNDPRVTSLGSFLRKSSLDELPQIFNVLKGDMSFVGPRPIVRDELPRYGPYRGAYLAMRPGITGLWQVSGRNDVTYDERVAFDQEYCATFSLRRDLVIILQTFRVVLGRKGH